jgi:ATP-dependent Clp protease protease subunit
MIHQPSAGTQGQITDMAIHMKRLETIKARMNRILADNVGRDVDEVTAACERDNFMTSEEALEFGLIDRVLDRH